MIRLIVFISFCLTFAAFFPVFSLAAGGEPPGISLFAAMQYTLEKNPQILAAKESVRAYEAALRSEKRQWLPGVSLTAIGEERDDSYAYVRVQQPLWLGGRITNAVEKAKRQLDLSEMQLLKVRRELMEQTVIVYTTVTGLTEQLKAARLNIDEHERFLDLISRRTQGQLAAEADVQLARSRYSQAMLTQEDLKGQYQTALNDLYALTRTPMAQFKTDRFEPVPRELLDLPGHAQVEAEVSDGSPRIRMAVMEIDSARINRLISRAEWYPQVYGRLDQDLYDKEGTTSQQRDTTLALVVQSALDGGGFRTLEQVRAADARGRAAQMQSDAEKNEVSRATQDLLTNRDMVRQLTRLYGSLVQSTGQTLGSYTRQYEAGRKSWLDLLNVQREHANARLSLAQVNARYEQTCLRLAVQMGRLDNQIGLAQ
ncbi:TolC family protein [Desulfobacter vibrioformis]|uniref:TolC family protein n=1 Tax=Desulfobacter vibrioformis TaxID=34031 RepID=UPI00054E56DC|nr:TolC family protein [Desulfobacter vibrioformis]